MKKKTPHVALMGRRNVGKSTLFNALCRKNHAITDEIAGLTRDILEVKIEHNGHVFVISDTPGLDLDTPKSLSPLDAQIIARSQKYLQRVDIILLLMAAPVPHPFDLDFLQFVRKNAPKSRLICLVHKIDNPEEAEAALVPFYEARLPELFPVSAKGRWNFKELLNIVCMGMPKKASVNIPETLTINSQRKKDIQSNQKKQGESSKHEALRIAIVGRTNSGKSSLFNRIIGQEKALVSEVAGTTRDSIDTFLVYKKQSIQIIDTAGMRKAKRLLGKENRIEFYSMARTKRAIREAQVAVLLLDGVLGITDFDKRICSFIERHHRAVVLVISKWDLLKEEYGNPASLKAFQERLHFLFPHIEQLPLVFSSSLSGHGVMRILEHCQSLAERMSLRIPTHQLNKRIQFWYAKLSQKDARLKLLYASQSSAFFPEIILFVNDPRRLLPTQRAYLENCLRKEYKLDGVPLAIRVRRKDSSK